MEVAGVLELQEEEVSGAKSKGNMGFVRFLKSYMYSEGFYERKDGEVICGKLGVLLEKRAGDPTSEHTPEPASPSPNPKCDTKLATNTMDRVQWRKEFKISGQIGEAGQKERLSFTSLIHQIDRGTSKGYEEEEIVEAVIRSMTPGLTLRSFLESKPGLDLPTLRRLLRSHYQEKEATELYYDLNRAVQSPKETPHDFLLRILALRQKILFASQEAGSSFKYNNS